MYAPAAQARFEQLLAGALPSSGTVAVSGSMTLQRASGLLPFVVHVKPMGVRQPDYGARRVAALVLIVEPGGSPASIPAWWPRPWGSPWRRAKSRSGWRKAGPCAR